jgi:hypothetical protein
MLYKGSILSRRFACSVLSLLFLMLWVPSSFAQQEPPLISPGGGKLPTKDPNAIAVDGWLLYPTVRLYSLYSDNLFFDTQNPLSVGGIGLAPSLTAIWTNGIHTTTLFGNFDRQVFPTDNEVNTFNARAGFSQKYEAMRDLIFTFNGTYNHQTLTTGLQNSLQIPNAAPAITVLPNGNTILPNGTILSPTGQPIGQVSPAIGTTAQQLVNASDQFTGTFSVDKLFNRGIISLSGTASRTDYENQSTQDFKTSTFTERASFWLGPAIYAYSTGAVGTFSQVASSTTTSYRVVGGLGTRSLDLFRGSIYFGHQGSEGGGSTAGGDVYGGLLSYNPTPDLTFTGTIDRTINDSSSQSTATNLALTLPGVSALQVPLNASTAVTSFGLLSTYRISQQWFANCQTTLTRVEYADSPRRDNSWLFDLSLRYDIWQNMSLTWEYRFTSVLSNAPSVNTSSNFAIVGATYRF